MNKKNFVKGDCVYIVLCTQTKTAGWKTSNGQGKWKDTVCRRLINHIMGRLCVIQTLREWKRAGGTTHLQSGELAIQINATTGLTRALGYLKTWADTVKITSFKRAEGGTSASLTYHDNGTLPWWSKIQKEIRGWMKASGYGTEDWISLA